MTLVVNPFVMLLRSLEETSEKNLSRKSPLDFHLIAVGETSTILNICDLILWEEFLDFSQHVWTLPCLLPLSYIWLSSDCCRHTPWASGFHFGQMIVIIEIRIGWMSAAPPSAAMALTSRQGLCPSFTCTASLLQRGPSALKCWSPNTHISCLFCVPQKQTRPDFCYMAWMSDEWENIYSSNDLLIGSRNSAAWLTPRVHISQDERAGF